jgi:hypothetical protein
VIPYPGARFEPDAERLLIEVRTLHRALWLERLVQRCQRWLLLGLAALGLAEVGVWLSVPTAPPMLRALLPAAALAGSVAYSLARRPTLAEAARTADRRLHLREQLATAIELLGAAERAPLAQVQIRCAGLAAERARQASPPPIWSWLAWLAACVVLAGAVPIAEPWLAALRPAGDREPGHAAVTRSVGQRARPGLG